MLKEVLGGCQYLVQEVDRLVDLIAALLDN